jgi:hypothetical protein
MKRLATFILTAFVAIGFVACSKPVLQYPATQFKLKPKADKANKTIKVSGTAVRLENDGWKLLLIFDNLDEPDLQNLSITNEPYPLLLGEEGGKLEVAWEVPRERWKNKKPFVLSLGLNGDSINKNVLVIVKHPAIEFNTTVLGKVVGTTVCAVIWVAALNLPLPL